MKITNWFTLCWLVACTAMMGCQSSLPKATDLNPFVDSDATAEDEIEYVNPTEVAVVWVDSVLTSANRGPIRGFGGRFFFYDHEGKPVRVDGELTIYAFDDSDDQISSKVPDRKYVFRPQELQTHYSESELGPTYNFWVPWGDASGPRMTISMLPVFKPVNGPPLRGEQSLNLLPGTNPEPVEELPTVDALGRQVSHTSAAYEGRDTSYNQVQLNSTTITVPPSLANQMRGPQVYHQQSPSRAQTLGQSAPVNNSGTGTQATSSGNMGQALAPISINQSGTGTPDFRLPPSMNMQQPIQHQPMQMQPTQQSSLQQQSDQLLPESGIRNQQFGRAQTPVFGQPGAIRSRQ